MKKSLLTTILFVIVFYGSAQDTLFKKVGAPIICKVIEIGEDEVKYKTLDYLDGPSYTISSGKLRKIHLANGTVHKFSESDLFITSADSKSLNKKNVVKMAPFSPLFGFLNIGYERVLKFGLHLEADVGIIGAGNNEDLNRRENGFWIYAGPKMLMRKQTYVKGESYYHFLHGTYLRPEIGFEYQTGLISVRDSNYDFVDRDYKLIHFGFMLNMGSQWVFADFMTLDLFFGMGMALNNLSYSEAIDNKYELSNSIRTRSIYCYAGDNGSLVFAVQAGLKVGLLF